ncbi:Integral membrane protein SED5 [Dimargaris verticillata]|uniref:Integral membrane protein SED5 n=1 Tax=Dimargaris verticillata TaxID=2761393 RepID=A0A9W8B6Y5_9FUNG|nr:Integral membrane protein SED5 [Dimargaris verticillata]
MATRSRTFLFIQYRNSFGHAHKRQRSKQTAANRQGRRGTASSTTSEHEGLIGGESGSHDGYSPSVGGGTLAATAERLDANDNVVIELATLPPRWVDIVDEITEKMGEIERDTKYLGSLHKKHLLPGFDDRRDEELAIEETTGAITRKFHECQELIKHIVQPSTEGQERTIGNNIKISMAAKLQQMSLAFRKSQSAYLEKMQKQKARNRDLFQLDEPTAIDPNLERSFNFDLTDEQIQMMQSNDNAIHEREREINEIAKSIATVAQVFKDMQTMVIDQGTLLDRIDYNVEQVVVHVKKANEELDEGYRIQKRGTSQKFVIILLIIIAVLVVILIGKHVHR